MIKFPNFTYTRSNFIMRAKRTPTQQVRHVRYEPSNLKGVAFVCTTKFITLGINGVEGTVNKVINKDGTETI